MDSLILSVRPGQPAAGETDGIFTQGCDDGEKCCLSDSLTIVEVKIRIKCMQVHYCYMTRNHL